MVCRLLRQPTGLFDWKEHTSFNNGLKYEVLRNDEADVAPVYTTEGQLVDEAFTLLEDDKHVWPPYNVAPWCAAKSSTPIPISRTFSML